MTIIAGHYQHAASSKVDEAAIALNLENSTFVISHQDGEILHQGNYSQSNIGPRLPGIPVTLSFEDGASFTPIESGFSWPNTRKRSSFLYTFERHWRYTALASVLFIVVVFSFIKFAIPSIAYQVAEILPNSVAEGVDEQTLYSLDKVLFYETELTPELQQRIQSNWNTLLYGLKLNPDKYQLVFRHWESGPNAMALANGTVVVTDNLAELMEDDLHMLDAILLHELGHVEHKHVLQRLVQGSITTVLYTLIFGDMDGVSETVLGTGVSLVDSAFSREMEAEADQYAYQSLHDLNRPVEDFSSALSKLKSVYHVEDEGSGWHYLQSHPDIDERIHAAPETH